MASHARRVEVSGALALAVAIGTGFVAFGPAAAAGPTPERVDIRPGTKAELAFPFNITTGEPVVITTDEGIEAAVERLVRLARGAPLAEPRRAFLEKWAGYADRLAAVRAVLPEGSHTAIAEGFAIHSALSRDTIGDAEKRLASVVPMLDRIFGPNAFRCTGWADTDFLVFATAAQYRGYIDRLLTGKRVTAENAGIMKKTGSVGGPQLMFMYAEGPAARFASHQLVHSFGKMLVMRAGTLKENLPAWLTAGFGSYCEFMAHSPDIARPDFTMAFIRSIEYEVPNEEYERQWVAALKTALRKGEAKHLRYLTMTDLSGMNAVNQYQIRSLVYFLVHGGPGFSRKFLTFLSELKSGADQEAAFKTAYKTTLDRLDAAWREYVASSMK